MQQNESNCFHCGDPFGADPIVVEEKLFCCNGCAQVYSLLSNHELGAFYSTENGRKSERPKEINKALYEYLDNKDIRQKYVLFEENNLIRAQLHLPQIHCASCIYLLEHLSKLNPGILKSFVNFPKRTATITIDTTQISLSELAQLLSKIGYEPHFESTTIETKKTSHKLLYQLGIAGFAFGSIMLWTFPEYLGIDKTFIEFRNLSSYLSLLVSIPVLLYSAQDYFKSAFGAIRTKTLNLDIPITIGIIALYTKSLAAIFTNNGSGYMDSFAAFIFFLLIGKWFQTKTYQWLSFERDFTSYFPIAVLAEKDSIQQITPIEQLQKGDIVLIRNEEIIPCDGYLLSSNAQIDYAFVTGEADKTEKVKNDLVYGGGKVCGQTIRIQITKTTSRSELTQLWNDQHNTKIEKTYQNIQDALAQRFIFAILIISLIACIFWFFRDAERIPDIITTILIVACPCALALAVPFTYGNMMRLLGKKGFYLRNVTVIEGIQQCNTIVFDKTGTLTKQNDQSIVYDGLPLNEVQWNVLIQATEHSAHPFSQAIYKAFKHKQTKIQNELEVLETAGEGIKADLLKLGRHDFANHLLKREESAAYLSWNNEFLGCFTMQSELRQGIPEMIQKLSKNYTFVILSGDTKKDQTLLNPLFPAETTYYFQQTPLDKKNVIEDLQSNGNKTIMIGDGLNDAGALQTAHVGIALSEDLVRFTPASDAILKSNHLQFLFEYFNYINRGKHKLKISFAFSITYNLIGISIAFCGYLTPFVTAILMPVSSITVVLLSTFLALSSKLPEE